MRNETTAYLIVLAFDDSDQASKVRHTLSNIQDTFHLSLYDSTIVVKEEDGNLIFEVDRGGKQVLPTSPPY